MAKLKIDCPPTAQQQNAFDDEDAFLEKAIQLDVAEKEEIEASNCMKKCNHGRASYDARVVEYFNTFNQEYDAAAKRTGDLGRSLEAATTVTNRKYCDVTTDLVKMEAVVSVLLSDATEAILRGDHNTAANAASFAYFFEQQIAVKLCKTQASVNMRKVFELHQADCDKRTLYGFLRKRISCRCLDDKYKEVKPLTKMGICVNHSNLERNDGTCMLPGGMIERNKMLYCTRCSHVYYCSPECQKAHWPSHREVCEYFVNRKAKFDLEKQS